MKATFKTLTVLIITGLALSCSKTSEVLPDDETNGLVRMKVKTQVSDFSQDLLDNKMASTFSYEPTTTAVTEYNEDFLIVTEVLSPSESSSGASSKYLRSNAKLAATKVIDPGDVFRLMVFDASGELVDTRDYISGREDDTEELLLPNNTTFTFISYSLNSTNKDSLDIILKTGSTPTLANTSIEMSGNQDFLFYKAVKKTSVSGDDYLGIMLEHQFNLLETIVDVSNTGYSIDNIKANLTTSKNSIQLPFTSGSATRSAGNSTVPLTFTLTSSDRALSNDVIFSAASGDKLVQITNLTIGGVVNDVIISPFGNGVTLNPGKRYQLVVNIVPNDRQATVGGNTVLWINGVGWMTQNLGADPSGNWSGADQRNLGGYYQWGQDRAVASGTYNGNQGNVTNWVTNTAVTATLLNGWKRGADGSRGSKDPCPAGFRLPNSAEFKSLISGTRFLGYLGTKGQWAGTSTYSMQLQSIRKASVKIVFPAQGYINVAGSNNGTTWSDGGLVYRGQNVYVKGITYTESRLNNITTLLYELLQGESNKASIYGVNGTGYNSTGNPAVAHPVRCVVAGSQSVYMTDREVDRSTGNVAL